MKLYIYIISFSIFLSLNLNSYCQNNYTNNEFIITKIDSNLLKYYYVIDIKRVDLNSWRTLLSLKTNHKTINNSDNSSIIKVDSTYKLSLNPLHSIMVDREDNDSVYLTPAFLGDIIIKGRLFLSGDFKKYPYSTNQLTGLHYK